MKTLLQYIKTIKMTTQMVTILFLLAIPLILFSLTIVFGKRDRVKFSIGQLIRVIKAIKQKSQTK